MYILRVVARKPLHLLSGAVLVARLSGRGNPSRIASWRTRRMARRKRNVSDLPYAAPPLSCAAFFFKVQNGCAVRVSSGTEKGVRESVPPPLRLFLCPKGEDSHHQFCLQPFPNVVVYAEIDVPALVVQLPHGEAGYVAAEMLQDNLHSVRVALCRCHNDRIGNKGIFRVAGFSLPFVPFISIFLQIFS